MKGLIVTADDFGLDVPTNQAIERAHREGILSAASLMVGAAGCADAVERARMLPDLRVGLHVVVVDGDPVLPPDQVPALVGPDGRFRSGLFASGLRYFASPSARRQLRAEINAQFEAFRATGLHLDHINAHHHMHMHPTVMAILVDAARAFGGAPVRLPFEPPLLSWRAAGHGFARRMTSAAAMAPWLALMRLRLRRLPYNDRVFGLFDSGRMDDALLLRLIERLPDGVTEIYLHPGASDADGRGADELGALVSPRVRDALSRQAARVAGFSDLLSAAGRTGGDGRPKPL
jgi:chitin disaccharide deacetylase